MPSRPTAETTPATALGVSGYTFADLHDPPRLASLYERFREEVAAADPVFWRDGGVHLDGEEPTDIADTLRRAGFALTNQ